MKTNPFATLEEASDDVVYVRSIHLFVHGSYKRTVKGAATWERYIEIGDLRLRIINRPGNHDQYQAQLTHGGKSYGKVWRIAKDSSRIKGWLEAIKKGVCRG